MGKNYYAVLGITKNAGNADVKRAYRKLSLKYHPVRHIGPSADEKFKEAAEAFDILNNSYRRALYDKYGEEGLRNGVPISDGSFAKGYTFHGDTDRVFREFFGDDNPFADLFAMEAEEIFGGRSGRSVPRQDFPIEKELLLTLEEVFNGCTKKMKISRKVLNEDGCTTSNREKILTITVEKGWKDGTRITFLKEGDQGPNKIPADIVFIVRDHPHPMFTRIETDLIYRPDIPLVTALTGGSIEIPTLDGRNIRVPINEVVSPGYCKKVVGEGMPDVNDPDKRGDLFIEFGVIFPQSLNPQQKSLIKQAFT